MADLIPVLSPLKGELGGNKISLTDCGYDYNDNGEPILRFSIAIVNIGKDQCILYWAIQRWILRADLRLNKEF